MKGFCNICIYVGVSFYHLIVDISSGATQFQVGRTLGDSRMSIEATTYNFIDQILDTTTALVILHFQPVSTSKWRRK